jgi:hypothetical protein
MRKYAVRFSSLFNTHTWCVGCFLQCLIFALTILNLPGAEIRLTTVWLPTSHVLPTGLEEFAQFFVLVHLWFFSSSSVNRGQSFLPMRPRMPFAFKNGITVSNLLETEWGDCFFCSRRNPGNFSRSQREISCR